MKKLLLLVCAFLLSINSGLMADIAATLDTYLQLECSIEPFTRAGHQQDHEHKLKEYGTYPHIPIEESTSLNWSGYAATPTLMHATNGSVTDVSATWTVPKLSKSTTHTYCSIWVGIDGYYNGTVEQIGTEHDWSGNSQINYAWFEMYPNGSYQIVGFPVNVADLIGAEVKYVSANTFQLTLVNHTRNVYTIIPASYTRSSNALRSSAEWIVEAPYLNGVLPLSNFGTVALTNCLATISGIQGGIKSTHWAFDPLTMKTTSGVIKSLPSLLSSNAESFTLTWEHQ